MKNLIVVGDSFCSYADGWPSTLASQLDLNLVCHGVGGQPWWNTRNFVVTLPTDVLEQTEVMVFVHTSYTRIPSLNTELGLIDYTKTPTTELENTIKLYYKYIHNQEFLEWAHVQWFEEIARLYGDKKICHVHCFPCSERHATRSTGVHILPNLTAISLNELGSEQFSLYGDLRSNHLSDYNNTQLGLQIAEQLQTYDNKICHLDVSKFQQKTTYWTDRGTDWR